LDLGARAGLVRRGGAIPFVPSTALLARTQVLLEAGGFDETLQFGEDEDLVWRLSAASHAVRYAPDAHICHDHRLKWWAMVRRRVGYASCAGALDRRHPGMMAAVVATPDVFVAAGLAANAVRGPTRAARTRPGAGNGAHSATGTARTVTLLAGTAVAATAVCYETAVVVAAGVPLQLAIRLVGRDRVAGARGVLFAITRPWLPIALVASLANTRARRVTAAVLLARHVLEWRRLRPGIGMGAWIGLRVADDMASAVGLWRGAFAARSAGPLAPRRRPSAPTVVCL
jgi:hypothetical protein